MNRAVAMHEHPNFPQSELSPIDRQVDMILRSARVTRYHTESVLYRESVGEHTYSVAWLVALMYGAAGVHGRVLMAALAHDAPEHAVGDVPGPTKRLAGLRGAFDALEDEYMSLLDLSGYPYRLTTEEEVILKIADNLAGALYCRQESRQGNRLIQTPFNNYLAYTQDHIHSMQEGHARNTACHILDICQQEYDRVFDSE